MKALFAALGAGLMYLLDPQEGRRRRALARDRTAGFVRRTFRRSASMGRAVSAETYGATQKVTHMREEEKELDDTTLARKVETEIFRDADAPKGQVDVNVVEGVVYLRGELEQPDMIRALENKARKVSGVRDVENLLHTPGTPAPTTPETSS
ncbi:MAG: BON domain-containing protein [Actinomycetota bacterium]|nr:BON domain-containing protein [Actinomycetota bacterium]